MKTNLFLMTAFVLASFLLPVRANTVMYNSRTSWEGGLASWLDVDLSSQIAEFAILNAGDSLEVGASTTLTFNKDLEARQVPNSYGGWSNGNTPRLLLTDITTTELTGSFSQPVAAFGLEMQPDLQDLFKMTLTLDNGTTLEQLVDGQAGAKFFGWISTGGPQPVAVTLSLQAAPGEEGFAFARLVQGFGAAATVPDTSVSSGALLGMALSLFGVVRRFGCRA